MKKTKNIIARENVSEKELKKSKEKKNQVLFKL